jgi:hypothetical protein
VWIERKAKHRGSEHSIAQVQGNCVEKTERCSGKLRLNSQQWQVCWEYFLPLVLQLDARECPKAYWKQMRDIGIYRDPKSLARARETEIAVFQTPRDLSDGKRQIRHCCVVHRIEASVIR